MQSFFIEPSSLPGGRAWAAACASVARELAETGSTSAAADALHCTASASAGLVQVLLLMAVYAGVLFKASQLIADGSELLLLVPSLRHIVGSVVLPVLGAVPDGAIVLFSGLGENAQEELSVGVGALAGSTSMLLTLPWFLSILAGRVNIRADGVPTYHHRPKLYPPGNIGLHSTGVQPMSMVRIAGIIMLVTSISYIVIQGAALHSGTYFKATETPELTSLAAKSEHWPALICFLVCTAFFIWYLYYSVNSKSEDEKAYFATFVDEIKQKAIRKGEVSLTAAFQEIRETAQAAGESTVDESSSLLPDNHPQKRVQSLLRTFFLHYDRDGTNSIDRLELQYLMRDLGERVSPEELAEMYAAMDDDSDGVITLDEFLQFMPGFIRQRMEGGKSSQTEGADGVMSAAVESGTSADGIDLENTEEEEEEEVPDDLRDEDPKTQINKVMKRAFLMMAMGTALVLIFSDPMVTIMSDVGQRIGIPPFYVSFLLAPMASNASELLAAYSYAAKKTRKTVTISFSTLLGAAIMNNTFVLAIFMLLLTMKNLAWTFTAETISILVVEICVGAMSFKKVMTMFDGLLVLALFPGSLALVAFLENVVGLD